MKTIALAALLAVTVAQAQTPRAERRQTIPWSITAGRPSVNFDRAVGIYIWHDGNTVHIVSSDNKRNGQVSHGSITLRGKGRIFDVDRRFLEGEDHVGRTGDVIRFKMDTHTGNDGFTFKIDGGKHLVVDIDQRGRNDRNVYLGSAQVAANRGILVFDLSR